MNECIVAKLHWVGAYARVAIVAVESVLLRWCAPCHGVGLILRASLQTQGKGKFKKWIQTVDEKLELKPGQKLKDALVPTVDTARYMALLGVLVEVRTEPPHNAYTAVCACHTLNHVHFIEPPHNTHMRMSYVHHIELILSHRAQHNFLTPTRVHRIIEPTTRAQMCGSTIAHGALTQRNCRCASYIHGMCTAVLSPKAHTLAGIWYDTKHVSL